MTTNFSSEKDISEQHSSESVLPILPLRQLVLSPRTLLSVQVGRRSSLQLLEDTIRKQPARLLVATQLDPHVEDPGENDLCPVAVEAEVLKLIRVGPDQVTAVLQGLHRAHFFIEKQSPYLQAKIFPFPEKEESTVESEALAMAVKEAAQQWANLLGDSGQTIKSILEQIQTPSQMADVLSVPLDLPFPERISLLTEEHVPTRLRLVLQHIRRALEVLEVKQRIEQQVEGELSQKQREVILRQQMKVIQEKLGEGTEDHDLQALAERIEKSGMSEEAQKVAQRQLHRLRETPSAAPDYAMQKTYVEWLCDLPWSHRSEDEVSMEKARSVLDAEHHGLERVKKRILEYIAVRKLAPLKKGPILCLVGPPGVGKTSLGKSIAHALGREFTRISLGGVRDEGEIRGHRRTYIGALPGRFIQAMKKAGTKNPVILLDEIDKLGADFRGDPSSALLEVLDPEQNNTFSDHYLEVPFDLSEVIFLATANTFEGISEPLLDRMEVIALPGYTLSEKREIAKHHLIPKQLKENGLKENQVIFLDEGTSEIIEHYTQEAGVRNLEREIANVIRGIATQVASTPAGTSLLDSDPVKVHIEQVASYLGPPHYLSEMAEQTEQPGVSIGLGWTPVGGQIIFVEVSTMPGKGQLVLTGKLGDVMRESAQAALSWVRAHSLVLGLQPEFFEKMDIHIHIPSGAMPKDGPSAGVTMLSALVSCLTGNKARSDVAMTGEITLRGRVLPVGGIKEKVLAAHRAGIKKVVLPERNQQDIRDIPEEIKKDITFQWVSRVEDMLEAVLLHPWKTTGLSANVHAVSVEGEPPLTNVGELAFPTFRIPTPHP